MPRRLRGLGRPGRRGGGRRAAAARLTDADGRALPAVLADNRVVLDDMPLASEGMHGVVRLSRAAHRVHLVLDLRHRELEALERLDAVAGAVAEEAAAAEGCTVERSTVWAIDPVRFHPDLVGRAQALTGRREPPTPGPLHDAAAVARAGAPTVMVFARTPGGISRSREEDAREEDLVVAIDAYAALVGELAG